jgi:hypothetical protein
VCALAGLAALVAHVAGLIAMPYALTFIGVPSLLGLIVIGGLARRLDARSLLTALIVGTAGGFLATLAYDGVRYALRTSGLVDYDGFMAIRIFGSWMTGTDPGDLRARVFGWIYHFWNGISFGIFYTMIFGRGHWLIAVAYALVMELCMLGLFPLFLRITDRTDFIVLSLIGHLFYGLALGLIARRYGRPWAPA